MAKNQNETTVTFKVFNKEFKAGIKEMENSAKSLRQELKLEQEQLKMTGSESQKHASTLANLEKQYELAKQKTEATRKALSESKNLFGENSDAVKQMEKQLRSAEISEQQIANKIQLTSQKLEEAKSKESDRSQQLNKLKGSQETLVSSSEKLRKEYELQVAELGNNAKESDKAKAKQEYLAKAMQNSKEQVANLEEQLKLSKAQFGENSTEVDKLEKELLEAKKASVEFTNEYAKATDKVGQFSEKAKNVGSSVSNIGKKWTMSVTAPIVAGVGLSVKAASDFESAFAGVKKTVDEATDANGKVTISYNDLEKGIRDMSKTLPASAAQISEVAENAGQLGIKTENVLSFTRTMIDMGESTNLSSEDAAQSLAKLANITKMPQENFDRLGSSIVALGNNMATTESDIVEMSLRLAGSAKQANMTEDQILGMAAAMSSVGINAEAGGGSMSRVMQKIQSDVMSGAGNLEKFASTAGMTSEQFQKAWKDDAAAALTEFVKGLGRAKDAGEDVTGALKDMGINSTQEVDTMLRLSGAGELLGKALNISADGWKENTALSDEASKRYETFESKLKILKNKVNDLAIEFGGPFTDALTDALDALQPVLNVLSDLAKFFSGLDKGTQQIIVSFLAIAAAIGPIMTIFGPFVKAIGFVVGLFAEGGLLAGGIGAFVSGTLIPLLPVLAGVAAAIAGVILVIKNWGAISEWLKGIWETVAPFFEMIFGILANTFNGFLPVLEVFKSFFLNTFENIKVIFSGFLDVIRGLLDILVGIFTLNGKQIGTGFARVFQGLVKIVSGIFSQIVNNVSSGLSIVANTFSGVLSAVLNTVGRIFGTIVKAIMHPMETAKNIVKGAIDAIKGFFNFKFEWPHLPLPHFKIKGKFNPLKGQIPSIGVDWYAKGGIFNSPTIIGELGGKLQGVGEAGREAALPLNKRTLGMIGQEILQALSQREVMVPLLDGLIDAAQNKMAQNNQKNNSQRQMIEMMNKFMEIIAANASAGEVYQTVNVGSLNTNSMAEYDRFNRKLQTAAELANTGLRGGY